MIWTIVTARAIVLAIAGSVLKQNQYIDGSYLVRLVMVRLFGFEMPF